MSGVNAEAFAQNLLLKELWERILNNLEIYEDFRSAECTCKLFQKILSGTKNIWLFEKVLPIMEPYISIQEILTCRSVCKRWRNGIDNFLDNKHEFQHNFMIKDERERRINSFELSSNTEPPQRPWMMTNLRSFMKIMSTHGRNPFIGHSIKIHLINRLYRSHFIVEDAQTMWQWVYKYFETFGKYIYSLQFHIDDYTYARDLEEGLPTFILKDLYLMAPNIKSLKFSGNVEDNLFQRSIIPDLKSLPVTSLTNLSIHGMTLLNRLILQRHLKTLKSIDVREISHINYNKFYLDGFEYLAGMKAPLLEKLEFHPSLQSKGQLPLLLKFFPAISKSCPKWNCLRLENINLLSNDHHMKFSGLDLRLNCPANIKILEIEDYAMSIRNLGPLNKAVVKHTINDFSFLVYFQHVEHVKIISPKALSSATKHFLQEFKVDNEKVQVRKYLYRGEMYKSNIWQVMPKLKTFSFENRVYTRKHYECLKRDA